MANYTFSPDGFTLYAATDNVGGQSWVIYIPTFIIDGSFNKATDTITFTGMAYSNYEYPTILNVNDVKCYKAQTYSACTSTGETALIDSSGNFKSIPNLQLLGNQPSGCPTYISITHAVFLAENGLFRLHGNGRVPGIPDTDLSYIYMYSLSVSGETEIKNIYPLPESGKIGSFNPSSIINDQAYFSPGQGAFEYSVNAYRRVAEYYTGGSGTTTISGSDTVTISADVSVFKSIAEPFIPNDNPYGEGEDQPPGGTGNRKNWDGETPLYDVPTANILDLGMCSVYTPTETQLNSFSEFLWSDAFSVDTLKKIVADPMDAIISAHMLPFSVTHGLQSQIMIGNIGSGVNADVLGAQFYKKDMGTLAIDEYYGNFFDYSPYTKYSIFLPYIGYEEFIPDDFVGGNLTVTYYIDAITGKCTACLYSSKHAAILYQYEGSMLYQIPITAGNYANAILGVASAGIRAAGAIISGGKSVITNVAGAAVSGVSASKPDISRSGGLGGASGWLGYQEPFIIRIRPNGIIAKNQQSYTGFPSYQAKKLSSLSGYTVVHDINLSLNGATENEYTEAENLLKTGVII